MAVEPAALVARLDARARRRLPPAEYEGARPLLGELSAFVVGETDDFEATALELRPLLALSGGAVRAVRLGDGRLDVDVGLGPAVVPRTVRVLVALDGGRLAANLAVGSAERFLSGVVLGDPVRTAQRRLTELVAAFNGDLAAAGRQLVVVDVQPVGIRLAAAPV